MGRGRAKAKQTKVARELKYSTHETDLERLQRELAGSPPSTPTATGDLDADDDSTDDTNDEDPGDGWVSSAR